MSDELNDEPRAYTAEEARDHFLDAVREICRYWATVPNKSELDLCTGVAFSILVAIDGCSGSFSPSIDLALSVHPDDKEFHRAKGDNWYEEGQVINGYVLLHDLFYGEDGNAFGTRGR